MEPRQSLEAATRLRTLLSQFDPGAVGFLEANHAALRPLFEADDWLRFEQLISAYGFADAEAELEGAMRSFAARRA